MDGGSREGRNEFAPKILSRKPKQRRGKACFTLTLMPPPISLQSAHKELLLLLAGRGESVAMSFPLVAAPLPSHPHSGA
jgi:hypothetical protein